MGFGAIAEVFKSTSTRKETHEDAIDRFARVARGGLGLSYSEMRALFYECFRKGDSAEKYEQAFQNAEIEFLVHDEGPRLVYKWRWEGKQSPNSPCMDEHAFFIVVVGPYDHTILDVRHDYHPFNPAWSN
jgi:hypothetical protein